jgi:hypothetical protein
MPADSKYKIFDAPLNKTIFEHSNQVENKTVEPSRVGIVLAK